MRKKTEVPINFEPTSQSPLPVSSICPKFEMIVVLGCVERYICLSAVPACPALDEEAAYLPTMRHVLERNGPDLVRIKA